MNRLTATVAVIAIAMLAGCTVGPKYQRPVAQVPAVWSGEGPWREAAPKDAVPKGAWWEVFHDEQLNQCKRADEFAFHGVTSWLETLNRATSPPGAEQRERRDRNKCGLGHEHR